LHIKHKTIEYVTQCSVKLLSILQLLILQTVNVLPGYYYLVQLSHFVISKQVHKLTGWTHHSAFCWSNTIITFAPQVFRKHLI